MTTQIAVPLETETQKRERARAHRVRKFLQSLVSHTAINVIGLFFLIPFVWMILTAFKSNQDVFHTPPRWLPYDNVTVNVNGLELPLYNVKTDDGVRQLALIKIEEGNFGQCEECEEEISIKRLEARPETTLCIRCKEDQERAEKDFG